MMGSSELGFISLGVAITHGRRVVESSERSVDRIRASATPPTPRAGSEQSHHRVTPGHPRQRLLGRGKVFQKKFPSGREEIRLPMHSTLLGLQSVNQV